jgi:hypothetical protein
MPSGVYERINKRICKKKEYPVSDWRKMYDSGLSVKRIAKETGYAKQTISRELRIIGVVLKGRMRNSQDDFWKLVLIKGENECWEWLGQLNNKSYGSFSINGKLHLAHRYSFELANGPIGKFFACHKCDNPKCVNPNHLFLGTSGDNMRDMAVKGRQGNVKLNPDQVREIRELYRNGGISHLTISKKYGVSPNTIRRAINKTDWRHVD